MASLQAAEKRSLASLFGTRVSFDRMERKLYGHDTAEIPSLIKPLVNSTVSRPSSSPIPKRSWWPSCAGPRKKAWSLPRELARQSDFGIWRSPADEERLIKDMILILQNKMSRDYPEGNMRRDAHPKNLACLQAEFIVEQNIPETLKRGIFASSHTYPAWIRISSSSGKIQSDKVKDVRGFAIKIMGVEGERFERQNEEKETQDFILMSYPVMPLGTVKLFHDAVYYSIKWSPIVFLSRLVLTGNFNILNELRKARQNQTSPLDIRYWSTTPYLCGAEQSVKYSLIPTSPLKSSLPPTLTDDYLTENMEKHLATQEASFDFMIQVQKDPVQMPVEDAAVEWSENESPFIKVATLRIPPQSFRTREREEQAEDLSFSPAHSLIDHQPIGGLNRARVQIYRYLSEFRHKHNNEPLVEPSYQTTKGID